MKAVIMAGGFGTRIHPLTINLPKPMIPLINRPIMEHIIELLKRHGIDDLVLLLYHQPEIIKNYFGDGSEFGVHITYVTPLDDFGTAGAVKAAARHLTERFLIIPAPDRTLPDHQRRSPHRPRFESGAGLSSRASIQSNPRPDLGDRPAAVRRGDH